MASTLERHGNLYRFSWYRNGKREKASFETEPVAKRAKQIVEDREGDITPAELDDLMLALAGRSKPSIKPGAPTFAEWVKEYLDSRVGFIKDRTIQSLGYQLHGRPVKAFGDVRLPAITHEMIVRLRQEIMRSGELKARSIIDLFSALRSCLDAAVPRWLESNPCKGVKMPTPEDYDATFLTYEEARLILDNCHPAVRDLVDLLLNTGLRVGEASSLRVEDVYFGDPDDEDDESVVRVVKSKTKAGIRAVPIGQRLAEMLWERCEGRHPRDLVFPDPKGKRWELSHFRNYYFNRAIAAAMRCPDHPPVPRELSRPVTYWKNVRHGPRGSLTKRIRITEKVAREAHLDPLAVSACGCPTRLRRRPTIHDLRHTYAGWLVDEREDFDLIRQYLGHRYVSTTIDLYARRKHRRGNPAILERIDPMASRPAGRRLIAVPSAA